MIETIKISKVATYGETQAMEQLGHLNFIFGANGAGKTTIGRAVARQPGHEKCSVTWRNGIPLEVLVYNRDFVDANFNASSDLKGIFTLGKDGINNEAAIAAKKLERTQIDDNIGKLKRTLGGAGNEVVKSGDGAEKTSMLADLERLTTSFQDRCREQKQKHDDAFKIAFSGVRDARAKFKDKILAQSSTNTAVARSIDYLTERARTVFGPTPQTENLIGTLECDSLLAIEDHEILSRHIVGKSDVDIAALIHRLGHSDWVKEGRTYFAQSAPNCPFCQQLAPGTLEEKLGAYFDETFAQDIQSIADVQTRYDIQSKAVLIWLKTALDSGCRFLDKAKFQAELATVEAKMRANVLILLKKRKEPSSSQTLESLTIPLAAAVKIIEEANLAVAAHNQIVGNIAKEKTTLTDEIWRYLIDIELRDELLSYLSIKKRLDAAIASLNQQIRDAESRKNAVAAE